MGLVGIDLACAVNPTGKLRMLAQTMELFPPKFKMYKGALAECTPWNKSPPEHHTRRPRASPF